MKYLKYFSFLPFFYKHVGELFKLLMISLSPFKNRLIDSINLFFLPFFQKIKIIK